jgi:uncharacterized protein YlzI (FlbEa/FlbD family)
MIHLIVIETRIFGKAAFAIENITLIVRIDRKTRIYTSDGKYTEVEEPVEEIVKRINQIVYGNKY